MNSLLPGLLIAAILPHSPRASVLVAYDSGVDAYAQAVEGIGAGLGPAGMHGVDLGARGGGAELTQSLAAGNFGAVIAVGGRALAEVRARKTAVPVVGALILEADSSALAARVGLEIPLGIQLSVMRSLFPNRLRVGILRNPSRSRDSAEELQARARKEGYTATVVDCDGPAGLLKAIASFKGKVDFLFCFPDPDLYNSVTIKPLLMATLEQRLPVVGFSEGFVRAGGIAGIYPDYRAIGRHAAELALRVLRGYPCQDEEAPPKIRVTVNQRVGRLLGIEFRTEGLAVEVLR